jgi:two-component system OmpR family response regulator
MSAEVGRISRVGTPDPYGATGASGRSKRVLVVDDDSSIQHMLRAYLEQHNMRVASAVQPQDVSRQFAAGEPSVVILDLQLGQENGLNLLRDIRSRSDVPVIIISGHLCDEIDRVVGLELGADDYLTKPFGLRELLARIQAVLRRWETGRIAAKREAEQGRCQFGGWQLDRRARCLTDPSGAPIALTRREYALLLAFVDAPQRPLTREYLLKATHIHEDIYDRSIDVQILRLRRKLETDSRVPRIIQAERGVGYVFTLPVIRYDNVSEQCVLHSAAPGREMRQDRLFELRNPQLRANCLPKLASSHFDPPENGLLPASVAPDEVQDQGSLPTNSPTSGHPQPVVG